MLVDFYLGRLGFEYEGPGPFGLLMSWLRREGAWCYLKISGVAEASLQYEPAHKPFWENWESGSYGERTQQAGHWELNYGFGGA